MKRELKIWGERWLIRQDSSHAVSFLKVRKGYKCSWHVHQTKYNLFVILKGSLRLVIQEMSEIREVDLEKGEAFTIKPGQFHEFVGVEDCECIEHMYVEYDEGDIERKNLGSKI